MFLATFAHFVARAVVLLMRFVAARVAYADNFGRTFARGMASCTACAAHSVRTRASLLAMPWLRAKRTVIRAGVLVGSMRFRSTVSTNHRVCDPMMIRFSFSYFSLLCSGLAWTSAARPLTYLRSGLARTSAARPFTYLLTCDDDLGAGGDGKAFRSEELRNAEDIREKYGPTPLCSFVSGT